MGEKPKRRFYSKTRGARKQARTAKMCDLARLVKQKFKTKAKPRNIKESRGYLVKKRVRVGYSKKLLRLKNALCVKNLASKKLVKSGVFKTAKSFKTSKFIKTKARSVARGS